ncbi:MAG: hypothetical protein GXP31_09980 [Kiritimatiellaeota bacterium]|nr:hypothetical protein [Kiritimatiellota bacterium]
MSANDKPRGALDREKTFELLLSQLPWRSLRKCIQANTDLHKQCTLGGYRLEPKKRKRLVQVVLKEARKADFSDAFCNPFFAEWYPIPADLHKELEDYFHSDEYKAYREKNDLGEDDYVLPDEVFERVFNPADVEKWTILVAFSPMTLTETQTARILDDETGSGTLIEKLRKVEEDADRLRSENARLKNEIATLRRQQEQASADLQELRGDRKTLQAANEALEKRAEATQGENRRLRADLGEVRQQSEQRIAELVAELERKVRQADNDAQRVQQEAGDWRSRYEQQCETTRSTREELELTQAALAEEKVRTLELEKQVALYQDFATLILSRIDWNDVGRQMKLTGDLKRLFSSLVRKLNYEEDRTLTLDGSLTHFWEGLVARERSLVHKVAQSNTLEVAGGTVEEYWRGLTDAFEDVQIGLEARAVLLRMLHEIFYQIMEMEDLQSAKIATLIARARKS